MKIIQSRQKSSFLPSRAFLSDAVCAFFASAQHICRGFNTLNKYFMPNLDLYKIRFFYKKGCILAALMVYWNCQTILICKVYGVFFFHRGILYLFLCCSNYLDLKKIQIPQLEQKKEFLLHSSKIVWRQSEFVFFSALTSVGALFILQQKRKEGSLQKAQNTNTK